MSSEEQRIKIAAACGWVRNGDEGIYGCWDDPQGFTRSDCPDYLNDLNAMHEAEKVLSTHHCRLYADELHGLIMKSWNPVHSQMFCILHATAAQRAEALLKTLGLWKEEPVSEATVRGLR